MEKKSGFMVLIALCAGVLLAMLWYGVAERTMQVFSAQGVTTIDSLTLRRNLSVGGMTTLGGPAIANKGLAVAGNITMTTGSLINSVGAITVTDAVLIDGQGDAVQLTVQGHSTQSQNVFVVETSTGIDKFTIDNNGNVIASGAVEAGSYLQVGTFAKLTAAAVIAVSDGGTIVPTGSYQPLTASGAVTASMGTTGMAAGYICLLVNTSTSSITINDGVNSALAGNAVLGQYDSLLVVFDGAQWIELARSNN